MVTTLLFSSLLAQQRLSVANHVAPAKQDYTVIVPGGKSILPSGRFVTPAGSRLYGGENCWNVSVAQNQQGFSIGHEEGFSVYNQFDTPAKRQRIQRKDYGFAMAYLPSGMLLVSSGDNGGLEIINPADGSSVTKISANIGGVTESSISDLVVTKDGTKCYAVDMANQDLLVFDLTLNQLIRRVKAGREPYAVALDEQTKTVLVANIGLFDYSRIQAPVGDFDKQGLSKPAFPFPSEAAEFGIEMEGRRVPGLGSARVITAHSVFSYELSEAGLPTFVKGVKTGTMIHAPASNGKAVGGSAPCALAVGKGVFYVSNSNNDTVQEFRTTDLALQRTFNLSPTPETNRLRGTIPNGLALSPDGTRLYVCESGLNAVGVIDVKTGRQLGMIPTGWFPNTCALAGNKLVVACQKGLGRGPAGKEGNRSETDERYGLPSMPGFVQAIDLPSQAQLDTYTRQVLENNGLTNFSVAPKEANPVPVQYGKPSDQIKYVVFITKENHTFDGIFGGHKGSRSNPDYAEFGEQGWIRETKSKADRVAIMPNHLRLARQFSVSDNFYMEPSGSGDGHRWLVGVYPSVWSTKVYYSGMNYTGTDAVKGRLTQYGSNGSQIPEDYLENGSLWENLGRSGISFRNYGEGFEFPGVDEAEEGPRSGGFQIANYPVPKILFDNTCWDFPIFNNSIPDIARFDWFKEDLEKNYLSKGKDIPKFMNITYCNDHGTGARPKDGYPYVCSFMADNDLALGRTIEYLSTLPQWKNMAVFVTQDDPGGDSDSVDRHRSFVLALGPWAKPYHVSHDHTSIMSIIKTIYLIFGLQANNMFDYLATDLRDMFWMKQDLTPYQAVDPSPKVFVAKSAWDPSDEKFKKRRWMRPTTQMDDPKFVEWMRQNQVKDKD